MLNEEPSITINGHTLSVGQAMTVRVAIESFAGEMASRGLGDDFHAKRMKDAYFDRLNEIRLLIYGEAPWLSHSARD